MNIEKTETKVFTPTRTRYTVTAKKRKLGFAVGVIQEGFKNPLYFTYENFPHIDKAIRVAWERTEQMLKNKLERGRYV